jgi:hypothetical protein
MTTSTSLTQRKWQFWLDKQGGLFAWRLCWGDRAIFKDHTHISISAVILLGMLFWAGIHKIFF